MRLRCGKRDAFGAVDNAATAKCSDKVAAALAGERDTLPDHVRGRVRADAVEYADLNARRGEFTENLIKNAVLPHAFSVGNDQQTLFPGHGVLV